jgi:hypothetical protein
MFPPLPKARGNLKPGILYAVSGENDWAYYGQITSEKFVGFFKRRDKIVAPIEDILTAPILSIVPVSFPSIGRALRSGLWQALGRFELVQELRQPKTMVQWPVGTNVVTVWCGSNQQYDTRVEDPAIQNLEVIAAWDAEYHIPERLTADFGIETAGWSVGGPVWRERRIKQEMARRFPDQPWHELTDNWVSTSN